MWGAFVALSAPVVLRDVVVARALRCAPIGHVCAPLPRDRITTEPPIVLVRLFSFAGAASRKGTLPCQNPAGDRRADTEGDGAGLGNRTEAASRAAMHSHTSLPWFRVVPDATVAAPLGRQIASSNFLFASFDFGGNTGGSKSGKENELATLRQAGRMTEELQSLAARLHSDLSEGDVDFGALTALADKLGEAADNVAATFAQLDKILTERLVGGEVGKGNRRRSRSSGGGESDEGDEGASKDELLAQAREANITGRSSMTKEELEKAVGDLDDLSKQDLLERARRAGIQGRSSMTKEELKEAIRAEESLAAKPDEERSEEPPEGASAGSEETSAESEGGGGAMPHVPGKAATVTAAGVSLGAAAAAGKKLLDARREDEEEDAGS